MVKFKQIAMSIFDIIKNILRCPKCGSLMVKPYSDPKDILTIIARVKCEKCGHIFIPINISNDKK